LADQIAAATFTHRIFFWLLPILIGIFPLVGWMRRGGGSMINVAEAPNLDPA
jgi:hypothetical protein